MGVKGKREGRKDKGKIYEVVIGMRGRRDI